MNRDKFLGISDESGHAGLAFGIQVAKVKDK